MESCRFFEAGYEPQLPFNHQNGEKFNLRGFDHDMVVSASWAKLIISLIHLLRMAKLVQADRKSYSNSNYHSLQL